MTKITVYGCDFCGEEFRNQTRFTRNILTRSMASYGNATKQFLVSFVQAVWLSKDTSVVYPDLCDTCLASVLYEALDKLGLKRPEGVTG